MNVLSDENIEAGNFKFYISLKLAREIEKIDNDQDFALLGKEFARHVKELLAQRNKVEEYAAEFAGKTKINTNNNP